MQQRRMRVGHLDRSVEKVNAFPTKRQDLTDPEARENGHRHNRTTGLYELLKQLTNLRGTVVPRLASRIRFAKADSMSRVLSSMYR